MLGGRPASLVRREVASAANYRALWRALRVYEQPRESLGRYLLGRGDYPWRCRLRTPLGSIAPALHHPHDMFTVGEVFCREDYRTGPRARVVVDIGSNIGISALYFLTRSAEVRCRLFEPVPGNAAHLRENLAAFPGRWTVTEAAVDAHGGQVPFGIEPRGRYGSLDRSDHGTIEVRCLEISEVLESALSAEGHIDVLKLDTEGAELRTLRAIAPEHLERIATIYLETDTRAPLLPGRFDQRTSSQTVRLVNRRPPA